MVTKRVTLIALMASVAWLSGCYETADVTLHEPGMYKGAADPLLKQQAAARVDALRKRFDLVQADR